MRYLSAIASKRFDSRYLKVLGPETFDYLHCLSIIAMMIAVYSENQNHSNTQSNICSVKCYQHWQEERTYCTCPSSSALSEREHE